MINRLLQLETKRNDRKEKTTNLLVHYRLSRQPRRTASSERSNRTLSHQSNNNFHINHTHFENTGDLGNPIGSSHCDVLANPFSFGSKSLIQEIQSKKNISIKCSNSNRLFFLLKKGLVARRKKKKKRNIQIFNQLVSLDLVCLIISFPKHEKNSSVGKEKQNISSLGLKRKQKQKIKKLIQCIA